MGFSVGFAISRFFISGETGNGKSQKIPGIPGKFTGNPVKFFFPGKFPEKSGNSREIPGTNPILNQFSSWTVTHFYQVCHETLIYNKNTLK